MCSTQEVNAHSSFPQSKHPGSAGLVGREMWGTRKLTEDGQTHPLAETSGGRADLGFNPSRVTQCFCKPEPISLNISKTGITVPLWGDHREDEIMKPGWHTAGTGVLVPPLLQKPSQSLRSTTIALTDNLFYKINSCATCFHRPLVTIMAGWEMKCGC